MSGSHRWPRPKLPLALLTAGFLCLSVQASQPATLKQFTTPEEGAKALVAAVKANDEAGLIAMLGPALKEWINSGDPVADRATRAKFVTAYEEKQQIDASQPGKAVMVIGSSDFPFPIPLVKVGAGWSFDPEQGKQEIIDRRVGRNELNAIQALLSVTDAQAEFVALSSGEYARKFVSSAGKRDGLYWPAKDGNAQSPLGPLMAQAARDGYAAGTPPPADGATRAYHGYRFRMLLEQGPSAAGGAYPYIVNGRMIGGFAAIAWPAAYGVSGYKTFMVNHDYAVVEADLGPETERIASAMHSFDPDRRWTKVDVQAMGTRQ